jgi:hypothetical protein
MKLRDEEIKINFLKNYEKYINKRNREDKTVLEEIMSPSFSDLMNSVPQTSVL